MADAAVFFFFTLTVSFVSMLVLASAAKVLKGWKRGAAILLAILSGLSFALQLIILLAVLALAGLS